MAILYQLRAQSLIAISHFHMVYASLYICIGLVIF